MQYSYSDKTNNMRPSVVRDILKMMCDPELISFGGGNPAAEAFPTADIRRISDELLREEPANVLQYSITEGYGPLREAGRRYVNSRWQVAGEDDELIVLSGSQQAMDFLGKLLCNEGDVVATENPAFLGALNAFRSYNVQLVGVEMQEDGVNLAALEAVLTASPKPRLFYCIPNFQNPTGVTTSLAKRKAIYELCTRHGVPVFEDDPYGALRIAGEALPPIKSFDTEGAVIYAASLSKVLAPGMRIAFCVGPKELMAKMTVAKQVCDVHTNIWAQRVCERFLNSGDLHAHLEHVCAVYRRKAGLMINEIDTRLGQRVHITRPEGGMFLWMTLPAGVDMPLFVKNCLDKKLAVVPGNAFMVEDAAPCQSVRLNFSAPSDEAIVAGVAIMAQVLDEMM